MSAAGLVIAFFIPYTVLGAGLVPVAPNAAVRDTANVRLAEPKSTSGNGASGKSPLLDRATRPFGGRGDRTPPERLPTWNPIRVGERHEMEVSYLGFPG
ncbi:MAG: hypothetical protein AAB425_00055, partial [Bdellovibrionota bacterium]